MDSYQGLLDDDLFFRDEEDEDDVQGNKSESGR